MKKYTLTVLFFIICLGLQAQNTKSTSMYDYYEQLMYNNTDSSNINYIMLNKDTVSVTLISKSKYIDDITFLQDVIAKKLKPSSKFVGIKKIELGVLFDFKSNKVIELRILKPSEIIISEKILEEILTNVNNHLLNKNKVYESKGINYFSLKLILTCLFSSKRIKLTLPVRLRLSLIC